MTETLSSLSMITKAGVQAKKIVVGVSSYGRSFQMTKPGCTGGACTFVGPESGATLGLCTGQAGYISDAEIKDIIGRGVSDVQKWVDMDSGANMMVYDNTQWVSYMDADNKANRTNYYRGLNFGGITDWAVDLQTFLPGSRCPVISPNCDKLMFISKGKNTDVDWTTTPCTNEWITDASLDPEKRWNGVGCDAAWKDALDYWKAGKDRNRGLTFSQSISNFFNGLEHLNCKTTLRP
jgi:GH18 family chitinase